MEEVGSFDGANFYFFFEPFGTFPSVGSQRQGVVGLDSLVGEFEVGWSFVMGVNLCDEGGLAEEEAEAGGRFEMVLEGFKGADGEIGGDK